MFFVLRGKSMLLTLIAVLTAAGIFSVSSWGNTISTTQLNNQLVVVDAGHGGMDGGGVGVNQIVEKDLNLEIAKKLEKVLTENGYQVIMTRTDDVSLHDDGKNTVREQKNSDLKNRAKIGNESNACLFISVHLNKYQTEDVKGAQVFYKKNDTIGEQYAKNIMAELKKIDSGNHRLEKTLPNKNLVFDKLTIPAVLVECGFISNPEEAEKLQTEEYQKQLAQAIAAGVIQKN